MTSLEPPPAGATASATPAPLAGRAAALFTAFRAGHEPSMAELVSLLTPILWHTARSQRLDRDAAEDAVQTVWLALVRSADSISDPHAVLQWLLVAVRREAWRMVRSGDRTQPTEFEPQDIVSPADEQPEATALRSAADRRLWAQFAALPERCRSLLRVIAFADRPDYAAVARSLGMPVGSIGPTRGRCLAKLRAALSSDPEWEMA